MLHCPCLSSVRQRTSPRSRPGHSSHTTGRTWLGKARARSERAVIAVVPLCCESQRRRGQRSEVCAHSLTARMGVCSSAVMDGGNSGRSWLWLWLKWCWRWWWPQQCGANVREPRSARAVWQARQVCMCVGPAPGGDRGQFRSLTTVDASCTQRCSWACEKHTQPYGHAVVAPTSHASHSYRCGHHDITYFHSTAREWRNVGQAAHRVTRNTTLRQGACSEDGSRGRGGQQRSTLSTARAQSTCVGFLPTRWSSHRLNYIAGACGWAQHNSDVAEKAPIEVRHNNALQAGSPSMIAEPVTPLGPVPSLPPLAALAADATAVKSSKAVSVGVIIVRAMVSLSVSVVCVCVCVCWWCFDHLVLFVCLLDRGEATVRGYRLLVLHFSTHIRHV